MRIAHVMLSPGWGGLERITMELVRGILPEGHRVLLVVRDRFTRVPEGEGSDGLEILRIPARGNWDYPSLFPLVRGIRRFSPDVIHANGARASWMGGWAGRATGVPVLSTLHNYMRRKYARNVDWFSTITRDGADYVAGWGVPRDRIRVIPNFSTLEPVDSVELFRSEPPTFVALGRFVPKKGFDLLLHALRMTLDRAGPARLLLAGGGEEEPALRGLATELGLGDAVDFVGWVDDVAALLDRGDVFVLPSRLEPFGIVVLEAMARGRVVVSTLSEGPREVLSDRVAYLAELNDAESLADAMVRSVTEREGALARARAGLELYRTTYQMDRVVPRYLDYYRDIIAASASGS